MRNLQVFREESVKLKLEIDQNIVAAAYDADHARLFFASDSFTIYCLNLTAGQDQWETSLLEEDRNGAIGIVKEENSIVCMEYLLEKEALVLGLAAGDILQVDPSSQDVEVVGTVEGGIVNVVLSPDGELLVVATGLGRLLLMTQDWDVLYEISIDQPPGCSRAGRIPPGGVQISWRGDGKYFCTVENYHDSSSGGKVLATNSLKVWERESGTLHSNGEPVPYLESALAWSISGERIATACCRPDTCESPVVVLFERNGLKRSAFDVLAPPEAKVEFLRWNCNSELLVIIVRCGEWDFVQIWNVSNFHWYLKQEWRFPATDRVKMFWDPEKPLHLLCWTVFGCLRRITLCWKSAVLGGSTAFVIDGKSLLITSLSISIIPPPMFLFKVNFPSAIQTVATLFDSTNSCSIAGGLSDGSLGVVMLPGLESWDDLEGMEFSAVQAKSSGFSDFGKLRHISWLGSRTLVGSGFFGVTHISKEGDSVASNGTTTGGLVCNIDCCRESLVECLLLREGSSESVVGTQFAFSNNCILKMVNQIQLDQPVIAIAANPLNQSSETTKAEAFVQFADGSLVIYSLGGDVSASPNLLNFASPAPWMHAVTHDNSRGSKMVLIGLDEQGRLQVNDQLVSNSCTSFTLHESIAGETKSKVTHLVFTTRFDTLHVINMEEILAGSGSGEDVKDISSLSFTGKLNLPTTLVGKSRANKVKGVNNGPDSLRVLPMWERGARLVSTVGGTDVAVILQTIRGNLETIYPRGLVLGAIATALSQESFEDAVLLARRHHINLNVIVDYKGWEEFSLSASTFVKQVVNLGHVTEVVQALTKENVMETTYKNLIPVYQKLNKAVENVGRELNHGDDSSSSRRTQVEAAGLERSKPNKIQVVLGAIRSALHKEVADSPAKELCILTTLARSDPPELEAALQRIKNLREVEIQGINQGDISLLKDNLSAEAAVKHLIWISNEDILFTVALGLYDLHLAAMVASHSQKDPKEFLPLLEELGKMPPAEMRYKIDCKLGRYESALRNCSEMGHDHFTDCMQLIRTNPTLFPSGLQIFKDGDQRIAVLVAWGDHLVGEKKFEDAAATFCTASRFDKALDAYRQGGFWEGVMTMAGQLGKTPDETVELAAELRDELQAMGRPREAAKLALDYCGDAEAAITLLLDAHEWLEVARLAYLHNKRYLVGTQLDAAVLESANMHLKELDEGVEKVGKYLIRFLAIHQRRLLLAAKLKTDEVREAINDDASSDISFASSTHSNVSGLSAYTRGSTRTRSATSSVSGSERRQARSHKSKSGRIRAGSPGEELALVEHLKGMALQSSSLEENRLLLQALLQLGHESIARQLQQAVSRFITVQQDAVQQIEDKLLLEDANKLTLQNSGEIANSSAYKDTVERAFHVQWQLEILK